VRHALAAALTLLLAACGGSSDPAPPVTPVEPVPTGSATLATFAQALPVVSGRLGPFPGRANDWPLSRDLSLGTPFDQQLDAAVELWVGTPTAPASVDSLLLDPALDDSLATDPLKAQAFSDLTFTTPLFGPAALPPAAVSDGTQGVPAFDGPSAALAGSLVVDDQGAVHGSTLSQSVDLSAVPATASLVLRLRYQALLAGGRLAGEPAPFVRIRVLSPAGAPLLEVASSLVDVPPGGAGSGITADLSGLLPAGGPVLLQLELAAGPESYAVLDDVSLTVDGATDLVRNGGFDAGLAGWTPGASEIPYRVVGAPRAVGGLTVRRSVTTGPGLPWARWVDLFENTGATAVATSAVYLFDLGSQGNGVVSATPGSGGRAFSAWDASDLSPAVRDVAVVHGTATAYTRSVTAAGAADGSEFAFTVVPLSIPAGGSASIVHFVVMPGVATGATVPTPPLSTRPGAADQVAAAIAAGFSSDPAYRAYMDAAELARVVNF
jgi:hypothetical protein